MNTVLRSAQEEIDVYLTERQRKQAEEEERSKMIAGCKTTASKTIINKKVSIFKLQPYDTRFHM